MLRLFFSKEAIRRGKRTKISKRKENLFGKRSLPLFCSLPLSSIHIRPAGGQEFKSPSHANPSNFGGFISNNMYAICNKRAKGIDKIYIGYSSDIERRLADHNEKATKGYTLRYRPWTLVYTETFDTKKEAIRREREPKSAKGRNLFGKSCSKL